YSSKTEILADIAAELSLERVAHLFELTAEDGVESAFAISATIRMKEWSPAELPQLLRLIVSPSRVLPRQQLVFGIASLRDDLEDLGGRPLLDAVASAIERAGIMFP